MIKPTNIAGKEYYSISEFAKLTNRTWQSVYRLAIKGNRMRKLIHKQFFGKLFILADELVEFPFTVSGRNNKEIFHYDKNGKVAG